MPDHPIHVIGSAFPPVPRPLDRLDGLLRQQAAEPAPPAQGSRRRKLWEIPHKFHCPVIGVCFGVGELRKLMGKVMHFPRDTSDFVLHTTAVGACEERSQLGELLQKDMERRFQQTIRRFSAAKTGAALHALWREATGGGNEIPGALWACWTHPACDEQLEQEVYGDIHMIQHQVGTGARADLTTLKRLGAENSRLRQELDAVRRENDAMRAEKSRETRALAQCIGKLRADLAGKEAWGVGLLAQLDTLRQTLPDLKDRQVLARRANDAEARAKAVSAYAATQENELADLKRVLRQAEAALQQFAATEENCTFSAVDRNPAFNIAGKCVLCVGGRPGAVDVYRQMIERRGGRFMHHDGGQEESLHRIDAALAMADLVICQAGCVSHNAYWRVKEQCKRTGKRCIYMKTTGISSLSRLIEVESPVTEPGCSN